MDIAFVIKMKREPKGKNATWKPSLVPGVSASKLPSNVPTEVTGLGEAKTCLYYNEQ